MNRSIEERTALAHQFQHICPIVFPEVFLETTLTVERAQYLVDLYGAMKRKDTAVVAEIGLGSRRDLETLELERKAALETSNAYLTD